MLTIIFDEITHIDEFQNLLAQISKEYIQDASIELLIPYRQESLLPQLQKLLTAFSSRLYWKLFILKEDQKSILPLFKKASADKILFIRHRCLFTIGTITFLTNIYNKKNIKTEVWKITERFNNADKYSGFIPDGLIMEWLDNKIEPESKICFMTHKDSDIDEEYEVVGGYIFYDGDTNISDLTVADYEIEEKDNLGKYYERY